MPEITLLATGHRITAGFGEGDRISYGGAAKSVTIQRPEAVTVLGEMDGGPALVVATAGRGQLIYSSTVWTLTYREIKALPSQAPEMEAAPVAD